MPTKPEAKSEALIALRTYLLAQTGPILQKALADRFGVDPGTMSRWLRSLEVNGVPIIRHRQKGVAIDRRQYFTDLRLSRHEAVVLMLSLRMYQQQQDKPDQSAVDTLRKLGLAMQQGRAPLAGEHVLSLAQQQQDAGLDQPSLHQRVLLRIGEAWHESRKVQIRYRPLRARQAFDDVFHPYLLEPSAIGHSTYAIGYSEVAKAVRVRKLERIERPPLPLDEHFTVAPDFDSLRLLGSAWRIWFDEDAQPVLVRLRFSGVQAIRRVRETRWHPSQQLSEDAEGRLLWSAEVDEPQELLPWVRGWGADCELLEPAELRDQLRAELRRQMRLYDLAGQRHDPARPDPDLLDKLFGG